MLCGFCLLGFKDCMFILIRHADTAFRNGYCRCPGILSSLHTNMETMEWPTRLRMRDAPPAPPGGWAALHGAEPAPPDRQNKHLGILLVTIRQIPSERSSRNKPVPLSRSQSAIGPFRRANRRILRLHKWHSATTFPIIDNTRQSLGTTTTIQPSTRPPLD